MNIAPESPFLSDAGRIVQKDLEIAESTDPVHNAMIVLEPGLVVHKIYNGYWFLGRPTLEDRREDLLAVTNKKCPKCRPDRDITTPELRAGWEIRTEKRTSKLSVNKIRKTFGLPRSFSRLSFHINEGLQSPDIRNGDHPIQRS